MELVRESLVSGVNRLGWLHFAAYRFQHSLYHQKHAFYFHNVEKWVANLWVSLGTKTGFANETNSYAKSKWRKMIGNEYRMADGCIFLMLRFFSSHS